MGSSLVPILAIVASGLPGAILTGAVTFWREAARLRAEVMLGVGLEHGSASIFRLSRV